MGTGQLDFELADAARGKTLQIRAYYPTGRTNAETGPDAPYPVIVFSHGAGGSREVGPELLRYWAGHGYVVFAATHSDSLALARVEGRKLGMQEVLRSFGSDPQYRISRVEDNRLILDSLDEIEATYPQLAGLIDGSRIGAGGHSAGAMTAVLMGGAEMDMPVNGVGGPELGLRDQRVAATLLLSGQGITAGPGGRALGAISAETWRHCTGPMMVMTGSLDSSSRTGQSAESRQDPFTYAPPGDKYLLFIDGANHMAFTGKAAGKEGPGRGELLNQFLGRENLQAEAEKYDQEAIFGIVQNNSLAFWDAHLKGRPAALDYLESPAPAQASNGLLQYDFK